MVQVFSQSRQQAHIKKVRAEAITAILPSDFLSSGITLRQMKYENNLQTIKTKNCTSSLPKYVSLENDS